MYEYTFSGTAVYNVPWYHLRVIKANSFQAGLSFSCTASMTSTASLCRKCEVVPVDCTVCLAYPAHWDLYLG